MDLNKACVPALLFLSFVLPVSLWPSAVLAQDSKPDPLMESIEKAAPQAVKTESPSERSPVVSDSFSKGELLHLREKHRFNLLMGVMAVTIIVVGMIIFAFTRQGYPPEPMISCIGLVLVIQATSFIVLASLTSEQLTTAIGVLGAIAGYLFGSGKSARLAKESPPPPEK